jgi:hypothetical protein
MRCMPKLKFNGKCHLLSFAQRNSTKQDLLGEFMSILLMVFEITAAFFSIMNSNPSSLINLTVSSLFIFALPSISVIFLYL